MAEKFEVLVIGGGGAMRRPARLRVGSWAEPA